MKVFKCVRVKSFLSLTKDEIYKAEILAKVAEFTAKEDIKEFKKKENVDINEKKSFKRSLSRHDGCY